MGVYIYPLRQSGTSQPPVAIRMNSELYKPEYNDIFHHYTSTSLLGRGVATDIAFMSLNIMSYEESDGEEFYLEQQRIELLSGLENEDMTEFFMECISKEITHFLIS